MAMGKEWRFSWVMNSVCAVVCPRSEVPASISSASFVNPFSPSTARLPETKGDAYDAFKHARLVVAKASAIVLGLLVLIYSPVSSGSGIRRLDSGDLSP